MSEGAAEGGGAALSGDQFGGLTGTDDIPVRGGETAQNPGDGLFMYGFYPWGLAQRPAAPERARRRRKRKRER